MRFYFNVIDGQVEIGDPEGIDLPDIEAAQKKASAIASELCAEFPGQFQHHSMLEVLSETGERIFALPITMPTVSSAEDK